MSGIVFMPPRPDATCCISAPHADEPRPAAAYIVFADPCMSRRCDGQLWCNGHAVCVDCGMGVREGRLVYTRPEIRDQPVDVAAIASPLRRTR